MEYAVASSGGTNGGYYGSLIADPNLAPAIKSQNLRGKANAMMSLEMGAFSVIGGALGAYYWGPSIIAGAQAAWPYIVAGGTATYKAGERASFWALQKYQQYQKQINFAYDYLSGLLTPPYSPVNTAGGAAAAATGITIDEVKKRR